jgi:hypothetical protein
MIRALPLAACLMVCAAGSALAQTSCPVPNLLQNNTTADATQVMSNFNTLSSCTANLMAAIGFPGGAAPFNLSVPGTFFTTDTRSIAITTDGSANTGRSQSGLTANQIYEYAIGPGSVPAPSYDAMRGIAQHNAGSTVLDVNGVAGYVLNQNARSGSAQVSSALKGIGVCAANNTSCWGVDTILSDAKGTTDPSSYTGVSLYNEFDYEVKNASTSVGGTQLRAITFQLCNDRESGFEPG